MPRPLQPGLEAVILCPRQRCRQRSAIRNTLDHSKYECQGLAVSNFRLNLQKQETFSLKVAAFPDVSSPASSDGCPDHHLQQLAGVPKRSPRLTLTRRGISRRALIAQSSRPTWQTVTHSGLAA
jgi:hypothetical protein